MVRRHRRQTRIHRPKPSDAVFRAECQIPVTSLDFDAVGFDGRCIRMADRPIRGRARPALVEVLQVELAREVPDAVRRGRVGNHIVACRVVVERVGARRFEHIRERRTHRRTSTLGNDAVGIRQQRQCVRVDQIRMFVPVKTLVDDMVEQRALVVLDRRERRRVAGKVHGVEILERTV